MTILKGLFLAVPILMAGPTAAVECGTTLTLQLPSERTGLGGLILDVTIRAPNRTYVLVTTDTGASVATIAPFAIEGSARYQLVVPATAMQAKSLTFDAHFAEADGSGRRPEICIESFTFRPLDP